MNELLVAFRPSARNSFSGMNYLTVNNRRLYGRSPRYVAETDELFFCSVPDDSDSNWDLWVVNNLGIAVSD